MARLGASRAPHAVFSAGSLLVRRRSQPVGAINTRRFGSALPRLFGIDCASSCSPDHQASAATGQASFRHGKVGCVALASFPRAAGPCIVCDVCPVEIVLALVWCGVVRCASGPVWRRCSGRCRGRYWSWCRLLPFCFVCVACSSRHFVATAMFLQY